MITFQDKVALNENPDIPEINKITDDNINDLKAGINANETNLSTLNTKLTNATTYSTTETVVGTWTDGKPIYRKVIIDTTSRNAGSYDIGLGISNLNNLVDLKALSWQNNSTCFFGSSSPLDENNRFSCYYTNGNLSIRNSWGTIKLIIIVEYTKTTDN